MALQGPPIDVPTPPTETIRKSQPLRTEVMVNGRSHEVVAPAAETLVETLRDRLGLTGAKEACSMGNCGACTVRLDGDTVYSCLVLTAECGSSDIATIECLADGDDLDAVQTAFIQCDALQCGFCTPGQIMSARALLDECPDPDDDEIVHAMVGNLCRCGAYGHIVAAVRAAADRRGDAS